MYLLAVWTQSSFVLCYYFRDEFDPSRFIILCFLLYLFIMCIVYTVSIVGIPNPIGMQRASEF